MLRPMVCTIWQNTGSIGGGNSNNVSSTMVKVGTLDTVIDDQLTKMQPGDITVEVADPMDTIWTFVQTQLAITGGLLPPWLQLTVGGIQKYLGTIDPSRIVRHLAANRHSIEFGSSDWSVELSNVYLGSPSAPLWMPTMTVTVGQQVLMSGSVYQCSTAGITGTSGPSGQTTCTDGTVTWQWVPPTWVRPVPRKAANRPMTSAMTGYTNDLKAVAYGMGLCDVLFPGAPNLVSVGDQVTCSLTGATQYTVLNVQSPSPDLAQALAIGYSNPMSGWPQVSQVTLNTSPWASINVPGYSAYTAGFATATFTRLASSYTDANYFTVQTAVGPAPSPNCYIIQLDTVDGLVPQDVLQCLHGTQAASWTVLSVDPELVQVTVLEPVTSLNVGDELYWNPATNAELVMMDARVLIQQAASPYQVDFTRFVKATLPLPVFGWLASATLGQSAALLPVSDLEPSAAGQIRVICGLLNAFDGSPDLGWSAEAAATLPAGMNQNADWTNQTAVPPASLMPYTVRTDTIYARRRNRTYHSFTFTGVDNGPVPTTGLQSTWVDGWTPTIGSQVQNQIFYDYLTATPRKIVVSASGMTLTAYAWNGATFGGGTGLTWTGPSAIESICNFPGGPAGSLLAITTGNTLVLSLFPGTASCAVPTYLVGGVLVPTPYGPYLIGPMGYAQVLYAGGVLSLNAVPFTQVVTCFWPNTFVARNSGEAVIMGRKDLSQDSAGNVVTETWLFRLALPPTNVTPNASIIMSEKIAEGAPVFAGAMLDPTKTGRVVGHYGGRLWQFDTQMPWTVERFTPAGMSAQECIEHVCQLNNAMAVPQPSGVLAIVSRSIVEAPIALNVLQTTNDQTLCWNNFFSIVRCTTQDGALYYDAYGAQNGGNLLEISNQPMLWTLSQAGAMAESYAAWFGIPRPTETQSWTYPDAATAPPWEALPPFARVTINGIGPWRVLSTSQDFVAGTCKAVLVGAP